MQLLLTYFKECENNDAQAKGFYSFLSKVENLRFFAFLTDLLQIYSRFHKTAQSDNLTISSLVHGIRSPRTNLLSLIEGELLGGWEEALTEAMAEVNGEIQLKGFILTPTSEKIIRNKTNFSNLRSNIINSMVEKISQRFQTDESMAAILEPFIALYSEVNLRKVHELFGSDLDLSQS